MLKINQILYQRTKGKAVSSITKLNKKAVQSHIVKLQSTNQLRQNQFDFTDDDYEPMTTPLITPLRLFKQILKQHNKSFRNEPEMKKLGDDYVKLEFKRHADIENPLYIVGFITKWQDYLYQLSKGEWQEGSLSEEMLNKMSSEQIGQIYELMKASQNVHK
jgi:hypothetical protein